MPAVTIGLPKDYLKQQERKLLDVCHEEEALCWLWAFPDLMPWPFPVTWLYTPVTGNQQWPGDLWGVDSQGDLLIVECKLRKHRGDPFVDFQAYNRAGHDELSADHWRKKFSRHLKAELSLPNCWKERPQGKTAGILPRSNHRRHIRRWHEVLGERIDQRIRSPQYKAAALEYLQRREGRNDPTPFYFALIVISNMALDLEKVKESGRKLRQTVKDDHVRLITAKGVPSPGQVRISVEEVPF